jgi:hypothetical protein
VHHALPEALPARVLRDADRKAMLWQPNTCQPPVEVFPLTLGWWFDLGE